MGTSIIVPLLFAIVHCEFLRKTGIIMYKKDVQCMYRLITIDALNPDEFPNTLDDRGKTHPK